MVKRTKLVVLIIGCILLCPLFIWGGNVCRHRLVFAHVIEPVVVTVNGYRLMPDFSPEHNIYEAMTLNTMYENIMQVNGLKKTFRVRSFMNNDLLTFSINGKTYYLRIRPRRLPRIDVQSNGATDGHILTTFAGISKKAQGFAVMMNTRGDVLFYYTNPNPRLNVSDFKRYILPNGKIRYTMMVQTTSCCSAYWYGELLVMDGKFRKIRSLRQQKDIKGTGLIDNHDSLLLSDYHYILPRNQHEVMVVDGKEKHVAASIMQEIKNGQVIFEWQSQNYPELLDEALRACQYEEHAQDYLHLNSIIIDPRDNHFIVSFRSTSSVMKIHRKTGQILWRLGGKKDDFGLTPEQLFIFQHTATITDDGYVMIFDNHVRDLDPRCAGEFPYQPAETSRILKFKLDEKNKRLAGFQSFPLPWHAAYMGSVFETEYNTYIVGYGSNAQMGAAEIDRDGKILWEMRQPVGFYNYRVYKYKPVLSR